MGLKGNPFALTAAVCWLGCPPPQPWVSRLCKRRVNIKINVVKAPVIACQLRHCSSDGSDAVTWVDVGRLPDMMWGWASGPTSVAPARKVVATCQRCARSTADVGLAFSSHYFHIYRENIKVFFDTLIVKKRRKLSFDLDFRFIRTELLQCRFKKPLISKTFLRVHPEVKVNNFRPRGVHFPARNAVWPLWKSRHH